jgi:hypothetical protein
MIRSLEEKFERTFRNHPELVKGGRDIPLRDLAEAAAWWIDKVGYQKKASLNFANAQGRERIAS